MGLKPPKVAQAVIKNGFFVCFAAPLVQVWGKSRSSGKHKVAEILVLISFSVNTYIVPLKIYGSRYGSSVDYVQNISEVIYKPVGFGETFCAADSVGYATGSGTSVSAHVDVE